MSDTPTPDVQRGLLSTDDAMVWAEEFVRIFRGATIGTPSGTTSSTHTFIDEGTMVVWFANAMQVAIDMYERRKLRTKDINQATEHVDDESREAFVAGFDDGRSRPVDLDHREA